jgi:predicted phosphoribosyltransferase
MALANREEAGRRLAALLVDRADELEGGVVLALPRGGVPVAAEVADALGLPLDVLVVRKLGVPGHPELGMGAIGEDGVMVLNDDLVERAGLTQSDIAAVAEREGHEVERRLAAYRRGRAPVAVEGRTVVVVDDGLATGYTARAAIELLRRRGAARIVLAVPVAPADAVAELRSVADDVVAAVTPITFVAIGQWYDDFHQVPDAEVAALLAR